MGNQDYKFVQSTVIILGVNCMIFPVALAITVAKPSSTSSATSLLLTEFMMDQALLIMGVRLALCAHLNIPVFLPKYCTTPFPLYHAYFRRQYAYPPSLSLGSFHNLAYRFRRVTRTIRWYFEHLHGKLSDRHKLRGYGTISWFFSHRPLLFLPSTTQGCWPQCEGARKQNGQPYTRQARQTQSPHSKPDRQSHPNSTEYWRYLGVLLGLFRCCWVWG